MYQPNLGRWMTLDPVKYDGGDQNLYRYVNNNTLIYTDPNGLWRVGISVHQPIFGLILGFNWDISIGTGGLGISAGISSGGFATPVAGLIYVDPVGVKPAPGATFTRVTGILPFGTVNIPVGKAVIPVPVGIGGFIQFPGTFLAGPAPGPVMGGVGLGLGRGLFFDWFNVQFV